MIFVCKVVGKPATTSHETNRVAQLSSFVRHLNFLRISERFCCKDRQASQVRPSIPQKVISPNTSWLHFLNAGTCVNQETRMSGHFSLNRKWPGTQLGSQLLFQGVPRCFRLDLKPTDTGVWLLRSQPEKVWYECTRLLSGPCLENPWSRHYIHSTRSPFRGPPKFDKFSSVFWCTFVLEGLETVHTGRRRLVRRQECKGLSGWRTSGFPSRMGAMAAQFWGDLRRLRCLTELKSDPSRAT